MTETSVGNLIDKQLREVRYTQTHLNKLKVASTMKLIAVLKARSGVLLSSITIRIERKACPGRLTERTR